MQKIGLLLDSTAITRPDIATRPFVKVASLGITVDGIDSRETDVSEETMLGHLRTAKKMTTSQPAPGDFLRVYEEFHREGFTHVLVVTLSDKISGTAQSALLAKGMLDVPLEVEVQPTRVASFGVALGAMPLIADIEAGKPFAEVVDRCRSVFADARVMFTLADLMNLFRGGRLNRVSALIGTILRIKPVIEMIEGKLQLTRRERTNHACYEYFLDAVRAYRKIHERVAVDVIQLNRAEWAQKLTDSIHAEMPDVDIHVTNTLSPVFFIHLGDQGFGIAMVGE
ncbi:MAG: DegV family protein [Candidatus Izemoplasmatales bacterium]